ncbi:MAG: hypothetical protein KDC79_09420 [Cyclobacteriaceae bacterium]|nr:hypothetical protein [Cyclobacteriaceae bacterium]
MEKKDDIDKLIKEALSQEEADLLKRIEDQSLIDMMLINFRGSLKWFAYLTSLLILIFFILSVFFGYKFFNALDIREMMLWGAGAFVSLMIVVMLKIWHWMQMDKNQLAQEIKRLELRITQLTEK